MQVNALRQCLGSCHISFPQYPLTLRGSHHGLNVLKQDDHPFWLSSGPLDWKDQKAVKSCLTGTMAGVTSTRKRKLLTSCEPFLAVLGLVFFHVRHMVEQRQHKQRQDGRANCQEQQEGHSIWSEQTAIDGGQDARTQT